MNDLTLAAADYLSAGLSVIALSGKAPNSKHHPHGLLDCISGTPDGEGDMEGLANIFGDAATTGVGILIPDNMLVADVDSEEAAAIFEDKDKEPPDTAVAVTPNGLHYWFHHPGAVQSYWIADQQAKRVLLFRGPGSYVAAPPSKHPSGDVYTWGDPLIGPSGRVTADYLPERLGLALQADEGADAMREGRKHSINLDNSVYLIWTLQPNLKFVRKPDVSGILRAVADAKPGNRNNILFWAVSTLAEEGVSLADAMTSLTAAAATAGLDPQETKTTIKNAYRRAARGHKQGT